MEHRGRDRMGVGFTTTYAISAHHHYHCEFELRSSKVYAIHYVIKFASNLRYIVSQWSSPVSSTNKTDRYDITEILLKSGIKQH